MKAFLLLLGLLSAALADCGSSVPTFCPSYFVKATLTIPYAELEEPFAAWYDEPNQRSRVDYYGDMVKTFQLSKATPYGTSLKIAPVTTEVELNTRKCLQVNGSAEMPLGPQSVLPDLSQFKCLGSEVVSGMQTEKWRYLDNSFEEKVSKYTMWITWQRTPEGKKMAVPVKYEMKGYNSLLGSHFDHYYIAYDSSSFTCQPPQDSVFDVPGGMTCESFPGPGIDHVYTFNPIKEFVHNSDDHVHSSWERYLREHGKSYKNEREHARRKEAFRQNMRYIHSMNRANLGFQMEANHLADKTDAELRALRGYRPSGGYNGGLPFPHTSGQLQAEKLPESWDWRLWGAVTPVKDQSVCGSCWSFGTTGTVEGAYFLKTGKLLRLSQQALIDCSWGFGNNGCDGGEDFRSYQWISKHGGIPLEADYGPYYGQDGYCHVNQTQLHAPITGWVNVTTWDEKALKSAIVNHGPISIAIDAAVRSFSFYSSGVYYDPKCKNKLEDLDHAVLAVGYGKLNGKPYWLVKNSWSNYWGNDGYILISAKDNNCGVMTMPTYVEM